MPRAGGRRRVREPAEDRSLRRGLLPRADTRQGENTGVRLPAKGPSAPSEVFEISTFKKKKKLFILESSFVFGLQPLEMQTMVLVAVF